ncbi:Rib/alpha-like domain-containing protein [Corynebacterium timonense]|uniref:Rib/alpha-like domain-containing protein n=1 Tax=Corynebacterium timonense TaxID=441500 RepID=UPI0002D6D8BF|nr:Rib/alpha-like domain-containing protein [Corynebacterium timonense]
MSQRFPYRTAIAGLCAVGLIAPAVAPIDAPVPNVSVAHAADTREAVKVAGPTTVAIKTPATYTAAIPGATNGKVEFYLDGVAVATANVNSEGQAIANITPLSYGEHTLTARYVTIKNETPYNVNPDGTATFTTPFPEKYSRNDKGNTNTDADDYGPFLINGNVHTASNPLDLQPGAKYHLRGRMTVRTFVNSRIYEAGLNPSPGSTYVEGTASRFHPNSGAAETNMVVKTRANAHGVTTTDTAGDFYSSDWGKEPWPAVNEGYVDLQHLRTYNAGNGTTFEIGADFIAPDVPGLHVPQYAAYKYTDSTHVLVPMKEAVFRIAAKDLPARNELPTEEQSPTPTTSTTAPAEPTTTAPAEPTTTAPAEPTTTAPAEPTTTAPAEPTTTAPAEPTTTAPAEPTTTAPAEPTTTAPAEPTTTTPAEPTTTTPAEPTTTTPAEPTTTTPANRDADKYNPVRDTSQIFSAYEGGSLPDPREVISNVESLPQGTSMKWTKLPTAADPNGVVTVTYPDQSTDTVEVWFEIRTHLSSASSEGSSDNTMLIVGGVVVGVLLALGLGGFAFVTSPQVSAFLNQHFGIRI